MSEHRETTSRSLALTTQHQPLQPEEVCTSILATQKDKRRKRSSTSSNGNATEIKSTSARRRSGTSKMLATETDAGSSRAVQRSTPSPINMASVNYTKTGRVSKAKKGLKVHECECGRSYTRAEHLRRHQRNHDQEGGMICKYPNCGKTFVRSDLLQRHEERHNEIGGNTSRQPSVSSSEHSAQPSPMTVHASLPIAPAHTLPAVSYPQVHAMSPLPEPSSLSSGNKHTYNPAYPTRNSISGPVPIEAMTTSGSWIPESWAPSPYSCSSGYASPVPCPEYGNMYATPPYGAGMVRTRASSNASFIEQNWAQASQSPTSSNSLPYSWAADEKSMIASTFPFTPVTYSTTNMPMHASIGTVAHYGQYDPHNLVQMDQDEELQLFSGAHYGTSQIACAYPFDQWLNSYWRFFHPTFPLVHRPTFASISASPMLCAAMYAIGAHYCNDSYNARDLHDRCVKLLVKRQDMNMIGCYRLCDIQSIFLVEVFSLHFARRCARSLSARFITMYHQLSEIPSMDSPVITSTLLNASVDAESIRSQWLQWSRASVRPRLLISCYLLDSRRLPTLADSPSMQVMLDDLHFPSHETLWDASDALQWWTSAQEYSMMPTCIAEATAGQIAGRYDAFQSSVLIAALYHPSRSATFYPHAAAERLLSDDKTTQQQLAIAKLVRLSPIRALLAVSGESWILGTKVTEGEDFAIYKTTLQSWVEQLWSTAADDFPNPTLEALQISVEVLSSSLHSQEPCRPGLGNELGLFCATLVLWAATATASSNLFASSLLSQQPLLLASATTTAASISPSHRAQPAFFPSTARFTATQNTAPSIPSDQRSSIPHMEIAANASHFLSTAIENITSFNVAACQLGCKSLLLWTKMQLRGAPSNDQNGTQYSLDTFDIHPPELVNVAIGQIERMLDHGWEDWGI